MRTNLEKQIPSHHKGRLAVGLVLVSMVGLAPVGALPIEEQVAILQKSELLKAFGQVDSCNVEPCRNRPPQVDLRVDFHASLGPAEIGPGKEGQGEVDRHRVQSVDRVVQVQSAREKRIPDAWVCHELVHLMKALLSGQR
jgi:hypothetical protein